LVDKELLSTAEKANVNFIIGMDNKVKNRTSSVVQMTVDDF